jgi:tetratricopeptide (TPR) repeat protein
VRVADAGEPGGDTRLLVRLSEFDRAAQGLLNNLGATPLLTIERDTASGEAAVQLSGDDLLRYWPLLQRWIQEDREFLLWRQKLNVIIAEWKSLNEDSGAMLTGAPLELAKSWQAARADDLNENEIVYINRCLAEEERRVREQVEREERDKQYAAERITLTKLQQQKEKSQKSLRRGRLRSAIVAVVTILALTATGWWAYQRWISRQKAADLTAEGNEIAKENVDLALEKYNEAIRVDPSYAFAYSSRGRAYFGMERFDDALVDFNEAIKLDTKNAGAYVGRGDVYWKKHNLDGALADYTRAIERDPKLSDAYTNRGKVLAERGAPDKAVTDYDQAVKLSPKDPTPLLWRGQARLMSRDYDRALKDFDQALTLEPDSPKANIKRADTLLKRDAPGDIAQAVAAYTRGLSSQDQASYDPETYLNRGKAYKKIRKFDDAKADFEKVVRLSQDKPEYSKIKADALAQSEELPIKPAPVLPTHGPSTAPGRANPAIYLHCQDRKDLETLKRIAAALKKQPNYTVANRLALVTQPTTGDVRYFHSEDESNARTIKQSVEMTLKENRIEQRINLILVNSLSDSVPQGWIEVWLPSLPEPSLNIRRPVENSPYQYRQRPQAQ